MYFRVTSDRVSTSVSDNQIYPQVCIEASNNYRIFNNFRRDPIYNQILEHVSEELGKEYLEFVANDPEVLAALEKFKANDDYGNPRIYSYRDVGEISPTTLRYIKVLVDLKKHFGVTNVIFIEGIPDGDLTKGHIDGIARFIGLRTVVVVQCTTQSLCRPDSKDAEIYDKAAKIIKEAGFNVIREPIEGFVKYNSQMFDTNYMNWLVGNGFVIVPGFGNPDTDIPAKSRIESYFPNRDVHLIEMLSSWASGGGVHCHTNDQPAFSISK